MWIFFDDAVNAGRACKLGAHILTETMEFHSGMGLDSYDRFFPNQDTLPKGGFGNLIALPLQKAARDSGNSVFVESDLSPVVDQWEFLSSIARVGLERVESIVQTAERKSQVVGVRFVSTDEDDRKPWN